LSVVVGVAHLMSFVFIKYKEQNDLMMLNGSITMIEEELNYFQVQFPKTFLAI